MYTLGITSPDSTWYMDTNVTSHMTSQQGISIRPYTNSMFLSQRKYAYEIVDCATMSSCKSLTTPIDNTPKLGASVSSTVLDSSLYHNLIGTLQYLIFFHPDITNAVQQACLFMHDLWEAHMAILKRIIWYIQGTLDFDIHLSPSYVTFLLAYTDAD
ncbi:uncharacterized mitochondrial protein AtMg00810-like [Impatiens glandulifera]|uniref:uncharacterized mitochondrial protein AtMg00810-like n=1 Tax=Impatiens glandulifera TaxID=253017 RepID=UPI001FB04CDD|nr:uncharacterized mitochondrial protein AtMg00810-like [Impatiens glandulifera]